MPPTTLTSIEEARTWTISTNFVREDQFIVGTRNDSHKHGDGGSISAKSAGGKITQKPVAESPRVRSFSEFADTAKASTGNELQQLMPNLRSTISPRIRGMFGFAQLPEFWRLLGAS